MNLRSLLSLLLFCLVASLGIFVLPWYFPASEPSSSQSYTYGFNNFAAQLWIAFMLAALLGYRFYRGGLKTEFQKALLDIMPDGSPAPRHERLLVAFILTTVAALSIVTVCFCYLPRAYYGETTYFISRLDAMLLGGTPYRDFNFDYGPAMVYFQYFTYCLFVELFSVEQIHYITLVLHWLAGIYFIYYILSRLKGDFSRTAIFLMLVLPSLNITLGLNYTPFRFAIPIASIIALHRLVARMPLKGNRGIEKVVVAAFLVPFVNFAVSPEMGMAAWLGCVAYFVHLWWTPLRRLAFCALLTVAALPAVALLLPGGYFESIFSFAGGGSSFPIYPTVYIVLFLIAVFCTVPTIAYTGLTNAEPRGSLSLALCFTVGLLIVPALGRCDGGHVAWDGFGIFLLFLAALSQARSPAFETFGFIYVIMFGALNCVILFDHYGEPVRNAMEIREKFAKVNYETSAYNDNLHYSKMLPLRQEYQQLLQFPSLGAPLGVGEDLERFLKLSGKFVIEHRLCPYPELYKKAQVDQKLEDLRSMEFIVIPADSAQLSGPVDLEAQAKADSEFLSNLFLFPVKLHPKNRIYNPMGDVVTEISKHYKVVGKCTNDYLILRRGM